MNFLVLNPQVIPHRTGPSRQVLLGRRKKNFEFFFSFSPYYQYFRRYCYEFWPARRAIGHFTRMATDSPTGTDNLDTALLELPPKIGCEQGFNPVPSRPRTIRAG